MEHCTSLSRTQQIRFHDSIVHIQTVTFNGDEYLYMEDIQRRFPSVTVLCIDNKQLSFLRDNNGNYLNPLRVKAYPNHIIEALESEQKSNDIIHVLIDKLQATDKKIDLILANTQETLVRLKHVMTQMYELQEYTTPRYFFILPSKNHDWKTINTVQNLFHLHYKLYFLCECSDEWNKLHIAPHGGYSIKAPSKFIATYGSYLRTTLSIARGLLSIGSFAIQHSGSVPMLAATDLPTLMKEQTNFDEVKNKLNGVETMLNNNNNNNNDLVHIDQSMTRKIVLPEVPLQGPQLRELESYLDLVDNSHSLGNLYRTVTDDGHVRWVCFQHCNAIAHNSKILNYIRQLQAIGGKYNSETKEVTLTGNLTNQIITMLCDALTKGLTMFTLILENCLIHTKDLGILFHTIINCSSVHRLIIINLKFYKLMGMSNYICEHLIVYFKNQLLKIQLLSDCQKDDMQIIIRILEKNQICRALNFFGYDLLNKNIDLLNYLKQNQELTILIIHYFMNIEFLNDIIISNTSLCQLKLTFWFNSSSILFNLCQIIGQNKTLIELDIMDHTSVDNKGGTIELLKLLQKHNSIKYLRIHIFDIKPTHDNENCLIDTLLNYTFITHLRISDSIISQELIQAINHASEKVHSLIYLEFYNCQLNEENISKLQLLYTNEYLKHLFISEQSYWSNVRVEICEQINNEFLQYQNIKLEQEIVQSHMPSSLCLDKTKLIDQDMKIIVKEAIINKQCQLLSLKSNKITSIGVSILAESLNNNNNTLETLYLDNNYISDDGVDSLVNSLSSHNNKLTILSLQNNQITDKGVKYIAEMLKNNQTLLWLYLGKNEISNEGVRILSKAIETDNKTLQILVLSSNRLLNDLSIDYLLQMIENNQSLKKLWIDDCNLTDTGKQRLLNIQETKKDFYIQV